MSLLVVEGLDGSGKSTQVKLLKEYFAKQNIPFRYIHFPRTEDGVFGDMVARFLRGEFGDLGQVNPYIIALLYAGDRWDFKDTLNQWLSKDILVLADRYVVSNIAFQCAKLTQQEERKKLKEWIEHLEYEYYQIPQPTLNLFLDAPIAFVKEKLNNSRQGDSREYLKGKEDIHESDISFQEKVKQMYLWQCETNEKNLKIRCNRDEHTMLPPNVIFEKICHTLKENAII
jgi:dTMP kinase